VFILRFDMRNAGAEHYEAAIDMARWAEEQGAAAVVVSEHHGVDDGYLPAPLALVSAMAAATTTVPLQVAALLVPLHDPITLAETMAVIDLISKGRVSYICGAGYRPSEFDMFGQSFDERGRRLEESVRVMREAWTGEPFDYHGRACLVTPKPHTPGGPMLFMGGGTPAAVRRAVRLGIGMLTERSDDLTALYERECAAAGVEPQLFMETPNDAVTSAFVATDPDRFWDQIGEHVLHEVRSYREWNQIPGRIMPASITTADTVEELKAAGTPYRVFTPDEAVDHVRTAGFLGMHPLCGGIPPEVAWTSLELLRAEVLPKLS
jgi:alkanesulfonate monooxygenase SsuD/methylene tetrahydromethanopterin reductase-like flavin-dependent oxidoreductase (luciferase family)